jgi:hypothetical protein
VGSTLPPSFILLDFLMRLMFPAKGAELLHFQTLCLSLLVLGSAVVLAFALGALERDDFSHVDS